MVSSVHPMLLGSHIPHADGSSSSMWQRSSTRRRCGGWCRVYIHRVKFNFRNFHFIPQTILSFSASDVLQITPAQNSAFHLSFIVKFVFSRKQLWLKLHFYAYWIPVAYHCLWIRCLNLLLTLFSKMLELLKYLLIFRTQPTFSDGIFTR